MRTTLTVALFMALCIATARHHNRAGEPNATPAAQRLVLGDAYTIRVTRGDKSETYSGDLVKLTDRWIVLHHEEESYGEQGVPVFSAIPGVGQKMFKRVAVDTHDECIWLPRDAATVSARTPQGRAADSKLPSGASPKAGTGAVVRLAEGNQFGVAGDIETFNDEKIELAIRRVSQERVGVPYLMDLPLVGALFHRGRTVRENFKQTYSPDKVLCVRIEN